MARKTEYKQPKSEGKESSPVKDADVRPHRIKFIDLKLGRRSDIFARKLRGTMETLEGTSLRFSLLLEDSDFEHKLSEHLFPLFSKLALDASEGDNVSLTQEGNYTVLELVESFKESWSDRINSSFKNS